MTTEEMIPIVIGTAVGRYPMEIANLLNSTGVTIDAQNFNSDELINAVFSGLVNNAKFNREFSFWLTSNIDKLS
jgi:hypothetical protein